MERPDVVDDQEVNLARNLAAAFICARTGIGLAYARKTYADEPVGEYWIALARMVIADDSRHVARRKRAPKIQ